MSAPATPLMMSPADREVLTRVARSSTAAHREVVRAGVLLAAAEGVGNRTIAREHGVSAMTVRAWRDAFDADGLKHWGKV
ncbi:helix-turn-helix domain-containing protein, partial [Arthrobacter castelli]